MIQSKILVAVFITLCLLLSSTHAHPHDSHEPYVTDAKSRHPEKLPTCSTCHSDRQCKSGKCWGSPSKCVEKEDYKWLLKCGFKDECEECSRSSECATKKCWGPGGGVSRKCTRDSKKSIKKCFPKQKKEECSPCSKDSECESDKCWGSPSKCVEKEDYKWLLKCGFKDECEECSRSSECATKKCWGPGGGVSRKCTRDSKKSIKKCFPKQKKDLCSKCSSSSECASGKCWGSSRRCVSTGDYKELRSCGFKKECKKCSKSSECATQKCWGPGKGKAKRCTFNDRESREKCFDDEKLKDCARCSKHSKCASNKCWGSPARCVAEKASYSQLSHCGFKEHCEKCRSNDHCATKLCYHGKCLHDRHDRTCH